MKTKKITELLNNYSNIIASMKTEIKSILKKNNNIIEIDEDEDEDYELPSVIVTDMNEEARTVLIVGIELENDKIFINGIDDYGDEEITSYLAEDNTLYEILQFIELYG